MQNPEPTPDSADEVRALDLSGVERRPKNQRDPEVTIDDGSFQVQSNVLGAPYFSQASLTGKEVGQAWPPLLSIGTLDGDPNTLTGTPTNAKSTSTVAMRYDPKSKTVTVDMYAVIVKRGIVIPKDCRMHIPIDLRETPAPACVLFKFGEATYEPIEHGKRKKRTATK